MARVPVVAEGLVIVIHVFQCGVSFSERETFSSVPIFQLLVPYEPSVQSLSYWMSTSIFSSNLSALMLHI